MQKWAQAVDLASTHLDRFEGEAGLLDSVILSQSSVVQSQSKIRTRVLVTLVSHLPHLNSSKHSISCLPWVVPTWQRCLCVCVCVRVCEHMSNSLDSFLSISAEYLLWLFLFGPFFLLLVSSAELLSQLRSLSPVIYLVYNLLPFLSF